MIYTTCADRLILKYAREFDRGAVLSETAELCYRYNADHNSDSAYVIILKCDKTNRTLSKGDWNWRGSIA